MNDTIETLPEVEDAPHITPDTEVEVVGFVQDQPDEESVDAAALIPTQTASAI